MQIMKNQIRWALIFVTLVSLLICTSGKPMQRSNPDGSITFSETGFSVAEPFLTMYQSAVDPLTVFGFPITGVLDHLIKPNIKIQYFQHARMEYDPSQPAGQQVTLANLGEYFYNKDENGQDAHIYTSNAACRFIANAQYPVCYLFLRFYDAHEGETFFGLPISEIREKDGRLVQYFERARMEWRPELPSRPVKLTALGQLDYILNDGRTSQVENFENTESKPTRIYVRVFPARPLIGSDETQTIFVIVQDQLFDPVSNAQVSFSLYYPNSTQPKSQQRLSTENGIARFDNLSIAGLEPNQFVKIEVEVTTSQDEPSVFTTTWFRIWW